MKHALACALIALVHTGCYTEREYIVSGSTTTRVKDGRPVRLDPRVTITVEDARDPNHVRVRARGKNNKVLAGNILVWIGTPISIVGTAFFLAQSSGTLHTTGLIMAPSAEPIMITGTILWVVGLIRPSWERGWDSAPAGP